VLEDARERLLHDVIGRALVAAFRAPGFRIQAWCAGAASAPLGGASLVYPDRRRASDAAGVLSPGMAGSSSLASQCWKRAALHSLIVSIRPSCVVSLGGPALDRPLQNPRQDAFVSHSGART
jgi:hypothetical protein